MAQLPVRAMIEQRPCYGGQARGDWDVRRHARYRLAAAWWQTIVMCAGRTRLSVAGALCCAHASDVATTSVSKHAAGSTRARARARWCARACVWRYWVLLWAHTCDRPHSSLLLQSSRTSRQMGSTWVDFASPEVPVGRGCLRGLPLGGAIIVIRILRRDLWLKAVVERRVLGAWAPSRDRGHADRRSPSLLVQPSTAVST